MIRRTALLTSLALIGPLVPHEADAKCAMSHLRPDVLTTQASIGGGIVVAAESAPYDVADEGDAVQPTWKLEVGGVTSTPKIDVLAPGLAVYRLPAAAGDATLLDGTKVIAKVTTIRTQPVQLLAPKVKGVRHEKRLGRRASAYTRVALDGAPPDGVVALVLADAKGKPRSFGVVTAGEKEITVYAHPRCGVVPNDTVESKPGDRVTLFWVDASGRTSPVSKPVTVSGKTEAERE